MQYHDDEYAALTSALRKQRGAVCMPTPLEQIVRRGRSLRARRRVPAAAGAVTAVAVTAAALSVAAGNDGARPAAQQATKTAARGDGTQQTAGYWTVSLASDDTIDVTVLQLRDPGGLQSLLRSDGMPVNVSFSGPPLSSACTAYPASAGQLYDVAHFTTPGTTATAPSPADANSTAGGAYTSAGTTLVLNPSALPSGVGLSIYDGAQQSGPGKDFAMMISLVHASETCTGN